MEQKLSEIILEMIEPYKDMNKKNLEKIMLFAISAWNMTVAPENEAAKLFNSIREMYKDDEEARMTLFELIGSFMKYKLDNYPDDRRFIINQKLDVSDEQPHLYIASTQIGTPENIPKIVNNRVGRNDPCPCGSGKKYKNCCGK